MRIAAVILAVLALAAPAPALAAAPPHGVRAAPAPHTDEDSLPRWLVPAGAFAVLLAAALAVRRL
ncbi:MAG TPA: hypothetical protein VGJ77_17815 [Gaiellaceae bacterium]|jgi:hypothetical protein